MDFYNAQSQLLDPTTAAYYSDQERVTARRKFNQGMLVAATIAACFLVASIAGPYIVSALAHLGH